ncbi:MAG TPA: hypothetical protein VER12_04820 [Polyangiaceae bacterium]|nr:hypothetical protein [Polyangiaceae bacterium]
MQDDPQEVKWPQNSGRITDQNRRIVASNMIGNRRSSALALLVLTAGALSIACGSSVASEANANAGSSGANASAGIAGDAQARAGSNSAASGNGGTANGSASGGSASGGSASGGGASGGGASGGGSGSAGFSVWPGGNQIVAVDPVNTYTSDLSGLHYEAAQGAAPAVLWAVQNQPSKLYRLLWNGTAWVSDTSNGWSSGKMLHFPGGQGAPDSEGVTKGGSGAGTYVCTERDNQVSATSRLSVLLFDDQTANTTLTASSEWNLTSDLPRVGSNLGLEAITWVPDEYLVSKGFIDESKQLTYDPASYADHGDGIFFVGIEQNGMIYGFALNHTSGAFTRVATIESGNSGVMELAFDRDVGYLWAVCDDTCQGRTNVLDIDTRVGSPTRGKFYVRRGFERPGSMPNLNNEGFTVASESTCQAGFKPVFYAEDGSTMGFAIRRDSIPCGSFLGK